MKKQIPAVKGTKDILPREARTWQSVETVVKRVCELYGYREIRTPIFEATELFEKGTGETSDIVIKEMYTFKDKGGRSLTLRPEYTPSVVRSIIENRLYLKSDSLRFYFMGPCSFTISLKRDGSVSFTNWTLKSLPRKIRLSMQNS